MAKSSRFLFYAYLCLVSLFDNKHTKSKLSQNSFFWFSDD